MRKHTLKKALAIVGGLSASHLLAIFLTVTITTAAFTAYNLYLDAFPHTVMYTIESDGSGNYRAIKYNGQVLYESTDAITTINSALNALTVGRTWKEKVMFKGEFEVDYNTAEIEIFNYTILDFAGSVFKVKDGVEYIDDYGIFRAINASHIEIRGLDFNENAEDAPDGWSYILWFTDISYVKIVDCDFSSPNIQYGFLLEKNTEATNAYVTRCIFSNTNPEIYNDDSIFTENSILVRDNVNIYGDNTFVSDNLFLEDSILSVHGEGCKIANNRFIKSGSYVISLRVNGADSEIIGNTVTANNFVSSTAIYIGMSSVTKDVTITNNIVNNHAVGIKAQYSDDSIISYNKVTNCNFGIWTYYADNVVCNDNVLRNCSTGLLLESDSSNWKIFENDFQSCTTPINNLASGHSIWSNMGYVTENSGRFSNIANGTYVAHGLAGTPDIVTITPSIACYTWLGASNSTYFQVYANIATVSGSWYAIYKP